MIKVTKAASLCRVVTEGIGKGGGEHGGCVVDVVARPLGRRGGGRGGGGAARATTADACPCRPPLCRVTPRRLHAHTAEDLQLPIMLPSVYLWLSKASSQIAQMAECSGGWWRVGRGPVKSASVTTGDVLPSNVAAAEGSWPRALKGAAPTATPPGGGVCTAEASSGHPPPRPPPPGGLLTTCTDAPPDHKEAASALVPADAPSMAPGAVIAAWMNLASATGDREGARAAGSTLEGVAAMW